MNVKGKSVLINGGSIVEAGPSIMLLQLAADLKKMGANNVSLICRKDLKIENSDYDNFYKVSKNNFKSFFSKFIFYKNYINNNKYKFYEYDILISLDYPSLPIKKENNYVYIHNFVCNLKLKEVIYCSIYHPIYLYFKFIYPTLIKILSKFYNSNIIIQQKNSKFGKDAIILTPMPPSFPPAIFNDDCSKLLESLSKFGTKKVYFYPSFLRAHKNFNNLIKSFLLNSKSNELLVLTINSKDKSLLMKQIKKVSQGDPRVVFFGELSHFETILFMKHIRPTLVFPSLIESWGLPLQEASSIGLDIIVLDKPYSRNTLYGYKNVSFKVTVDRFWENNIEH